MSELRFYDFFAGVGMAELGLAPDWKCVWANDIDPKKAAIYASNHDPSVYALGDIAGITAADLTTDAVMAWASFPCQDLSLAGWGRGMSAERSGTFWQFYRIMSELKHIGRRPPLIVLENVVGMLRGRDFQSLCEALDSLGMQFGTLVIDAKRFVPQSRPRVFVVALERDANCDKWVSRQPIPDWSPKPLIDAYDQLPTRLQRSWRWWNLSVPTLAVSPIENMIDVEQDIVPWNSDAETARILNLMSPTNRRKVEIAVETGAKSIGFLYKRTRQGHQRAEIRFDGIAGCIRTPTGGSSRQTVVIIEGGHVRSRLMTPREAARLMGVEDAFVLANSYNDSYHAIGDGVAVPVVAWLARNLLTPIAKELENRVIDHRSSGVASFPRTIAAQPALMEQRSRWVG